LTAREGEVLLLVAAGLGNAEIAERLFLGPNPERVHVARVLAEIGGPNRAAATECSIQDCLAWPSPSLLRPHGRSSRRGLFVLFHLMWTMLGVDSG
jgi:hypothetical protein